MGKQVPLFRWIVAAVMVLGVAGVLLWAPSDLDTLRVALLGVLLAGAVAMAIYDWYQTKTKKRRGERDAKHHPGTHF